MAETMFDPGFTPKPPYPPDWVGIAERVRVAANHRCQDCGAQGLTPSEYPTWAEPQNRPRMLEVHHADGNPANCNPTNLRALCKPCHNRRHRIERERRKRLGQTALPGLG